MVSSVSSTLVRERAKARGEPSWLVDARVEAFEAYQKMEAPRWRRTDLGQVPLEALALRAGEARALPVKRHEGVLQLPLAEAAREHEDLVRPLLTVSPRADKWEALHAALWTTGSLLHVEKRVEVASAVSLDEPFPRDGALARDLLVLEPQAKLNVLVRATGASSGALVHHGMDIHLRDGANLAITTLQDVDHGAILLSTKRATLHRDARLTWVDGQFGSGTSVTVNENLLLGQGSALNFIGAFFGSRGQHLDITTSALHEGMHTESVLNMKGALNEDGYSANYSIVNIGPHAKNSSGHQKQETLLLSEGARADAIPKLDVENNDVSASHGATVGQVDPEQLFYLRARGFDMLAAKRLIVEGFFDPLLREIPDEKVREELGRALVGRLRK
jgi:Fe-S cluster assembly protein SufD